MTTDLPTQATPEPRSSGNPPPSVRFSTDQGSDVDDSIQSSLGADLAVVRSLSGDLLTKRFYKKPNGRYARLQAPPLTRGELSVRRTTPHDLATLIENLRPDEVLMLGLPSNGQLEVELTTKGNPKTGAIARTKGNFRYPDGPGLLALDFDHLPEGTGLEEIPELMGQVLPALGSAPMVVVESASSNIYDGDQMVRGVGGAHAYVFVSNGVDVPELARRLRDRALLAGLGWCFISGSGRAEVRVPWDATVFQENRMFYAAGAHCEPPLTQMRHPRVFNPAGEPLSLLAVPALDQTQLERIRQIEHDILGEHRGAAEEKRTEYRQRRIREGVRAELLDRVLETQQLEGDYPIHLSDGQSITVAEILAKPAQYHGRTCLDPEEPNYRGGRVCGKIYTENKIEPVIYSFAHGGRTFRLVRDAAERAQEARSEFDPVISRNGTHPTAQPRELATSPKPALPGRAITLTDTGNADTLINLHGDQLRYVSKWGKWLVWNGFRWDLDFGDVAVSELAKSVGVRLRQEAAGESSPDRATRLFTAGNRALAASGISAMVKLARGIPGVPLDHELLDADPWLLGVQNGVIDLRTGELRAARPGDLITMQCPVEYDPKAEAPRWEEAIKEWFPDPEVRGFVQRLAGAALYGGQRDHVLVIDYGTGRNGKGAYSRAISNVLGPYAATVHMSLIVDQGRDQHDTVKSHLFRVRLATAAETKRRVALNEASIKALTGGDRIQARRMREDPWEFDPTHMLRLQTNHLPEISGRDEGIWRRIRVLKWGTNFEGREDPQLDEKLAAEAPGILRWMVEGCLAWQREGLAEPEQVKKDTLEYRSAEDKCARFADDMGVQFIPEGRTEVRRMNELVGRWAQETGVQLSSGEVADWLTAKGCGRRKSRIDGVQARRWYGVHAPCSFEDEILE
jgi:P4 family phage/plasmid primase-like protien